MERINKIVITLICAFYAFIVSFDNYQPIGDDNTTTGIYLKGTSWAVSPSNYNYFTFVFTSDNTLYQEGYYIVNNAEGGMWVGSDFWKNGTEYGAWSGTYNYYLNGRNGEIRYPNGGRKVAEFIVVTDKNGNPTSLILTTYDMEPGDGGEQFTLFRIQ